VAISPHELSRDVLNGEACFRPTGHKVTDNLKNLRLGGFRALFQEIVVHFGDVRDNTLPFGRVADHRDERPEDLLKPRLEIARTSADIRPHVAEVPKTPEEELVADLTCLFVEAIIEIQRDLAPYLASTHVLRDAAALQGAVLKEAAGRDDLRPEDVVRPRVELLLR